MKWWKYISNLGVDESFTDLETKRARLTNRMIFISFCLSLPYYPIFISQGVVIPIIKALTFNIIVFSLYFITARKKHELAALILCYVALIHITSDTIMNEGGTGKFYLIPLSILGFTLMKDRLKGLIVFLSAFAAFFVAHFGPDYIDPIVKNSGNGDEVKFLINMSLIFLGTLYFILQLIDTNKRYEKAIVEQKETIEQQHKELMGTHKDIQDSILYAKRIQTAILPSDEYLNAELKNGFVLYKPKDVVAGDFYWLERREEKLFVAAADCTGHGVPGAMVSVICNNALNRAIREYQLTDPGQILDTTKTIVTKEFEKSKDEVRDGMDIALCVIEGQTLHFAGAHNSAWIVRAGELIELKADRQPVGEFDWHKPFNTHTFDLQKDDVVYLFTDGYPDQFGGENGKKLKLKRFMDWLLDIHQMDMESQQKELDKRLSAWMGSIEQIDDICVIGMRI